ncbi:MAG: WS/DGAT/MGAT family O-acyltransferase [Woeseiaceae bacterium]
MMKQLSGLDSMFLYSENSRMPLEVSSLLIYDPSTAPRGIVRFKEVLATFDNRIERAGIFHRKILELPLSMDHPYWIDDENFDIEYHVRHIALPKPGDWRQLMIQVSRLQSRELDKSRPLWEAYVIEGLDNIKRLPKGCFAVFMKMHHSTIDGVSGAALQAAVHDFEPVQPDAADYTPGIRDFSGSAPNMASLVAKGVINNMNKSAKLMLGIGGAIPRLVKARMATSDEEKPDIPITVFNNGRVSANRVIDGRMYDLQVIKAIAKSQPDAKVNDVALAIVSGALRKYLESKDELPPETLIGACPLNVRKDDSVDADNMVSMMNTPLCTDIADPVLRLRAIVQGTRKAKEFTEILGADTLTTIPMNLPAFIARGLMQPLMNIATRFDAVSFNTMISNVAGFQKPLYFCGAKMIAMFGMGPVVDRVGLFHTVFSYDGKITFTFTACRDMLPDPEFYADCLQASFDELKKATLKPKTRARKKTKKKTKTKKKAAAKKPMSRKPETRKIAATQKHEGQQDVGQPSA